MSNEVKKHKTTYYNRHALFVLQKAFLKMRDLEKNEISVAELSDEFKFSTESLRIHLNYLSARRSLINVELKDDYSDSIVTLTEKGYSIVKILRDIKYQTMYNANLGRLPNKKPAKHKQTFYNRQSLFIPLRVFTIMREEGLEEMSVADFEDRVPFGIESLKIHMQYLSRESENGSIKPIIKLSHDDWKDTETMLISFTDFGKDVIHLLRDIKYKSLYDLGAGKKRVFA